MISVKASRTEVQISQIHNHADGHTGYEPADQPSGTKPQEDGCNLNGNLRDVVDKVRDLTDAHFSGSCSTRVDCRIERTDKESDEQPQRKIGRKEIGSEKMHRDEGYGSNQNRPTLSAMNAVKSAF